MICGRYMFRVHVSSELSKAQVCDASYCCDISTSHIGCTHHTITYSQTINRDIL